MRDGRLAMKLTRDVTDQSVVLFKEYYEMCQSATNLIIMI